MGMGKYHKAIWLLCGFGYFVDLMWAQVSAAEAFLVNLPFCTDQTTFSRFCNDLGSRIARYRSIPGVWYSCRTTGSHFQCYVGRIDFRSVLLGYRCRSRR